MSIQTARQSRWRRLQGKRKRQLCSLPARRACVGLRDVVLQSVDMPVQRPGAVQAHVSCFDRVKMGALMGFAIGMASGAIFGTATAFR